MLNRQAKEIAASDFRLPTDTFIYAVTQLSDSCAAISSDDSLTTFDERSLGINSQLRNCHRGITALCATSDRQSPVTAGRDGLVKVWDTRAGQAVLNFTCPGTKPISAICVNGATLAAGTESAKEGLGEVSVLLWDTRNPSSVVRDYKESHTDTITQLAFHPSSPSTLLSASTDGLVSLFNSTIADEDDALIQVLNHSAAVHCAGFVTDAQVYAISSDEQMSLYTLDTAGYGADNDDVVTPDIALGDVRARLRSAYVVDILSDERSGGVKWIASGDTTVKSLYLTPLEAVIGAQDTQTPIECRDAVAFVGAHGEEVVRDMLFHKETGRVLTCGEDGHVRVWTVPDHAGDANKDREKDDKRKRKHKKGYKPY